ncbi:ABC transporter ATP-binding protein [Phytoactinopolyspora limicola]|uniref:ABC transporter ATP-binding protein n=1 Tax=Phytoactinopolyspora limicola TaxID=2715536 RepID=UPI0014096BB6|nr:ABC transporter ATP-binding protein [Phytoactinopolyspora limicola]
MELRTEDLTVEIDGKALVADLRLDAVSGQVLGLVGPNGSGKSTALRCIYRALKPSRGVVRIGGADLTDLPLRESAQRIAALTQQGEADFDFTVDEVVALGRTPHKHGNQPLTAAERELCRTAMAQMDVLHLADRGILGLSGGERQRVLVARALVQQPEILVLDEPTNHLDIRHQIELLGYLRGCGRTVIVVLHDLNLASAVCDHIAVLAGGRLVTHGTPTKVLTRELIVEVFGVEAVIVRHPLSGDPQILFALDGMPSSTPTSAPTPARLV